MDYTWLAGKVDHPRSWLGCLIFMNTHHRILGGRFGEIPKPIRDDAFAQGGYCIDAPDSLPAGGCEWFQINDEDGIPHQITASREVTHNAIAQGREPGLSGEASLGATGYTSLHR